MAENNKSYRIRTTVGREADTFLNVHLDQDYNTLEILSLKISDKDVYKLHNADYGVIVGRVLANGNFGVPNAKISVFIEADQSNSNLDMWELYPYTSTSTKNSKDIRYNLLPDQSVKDCHKAVGTFPNKTYLLDNDAILEVFDKYYIYTTRTNAAGDYLICGVPTGMQTLHMDLDLSDCGILSQRPRDFVYKGYTIEQFENPNQFKKDENLDGLSQIFSQNQPVYVQPFWGNEENGDTIGITRADIEIAFKFEPTCVFMGSAISDNASNGVGKKCVPTNQMGAMDELTAGEGTIEMIRKTPGGNVEEFSIKGNQLIDGNGVWCYQIPMNLDYMMTDEYGNMVPTDDPEKGIPTRTRVRFRASLTDMEESSQSYYRAKYLIPNNPEIDRGKVDYNFGTYTDEDSYRDLFWNGVYTVKSYIPRFQKSKRWRNERFSGIKNCNYYGNNNPMPYNNLRIKLPFMFTVLCIFVKLFIKIVTLINRIQGALLNGLWWVGSAEKSVKSGLHCTFIGDGLCPDMEGWYFAPGCSKGFRTKNWLGADSNKRLNIVRMLKENTLKAATGAGNSPGELDEEGQDVVNSTEYIDETSIDTQNTTTSEEETACLTFDVDYLLNCFEMNLANEYRVIKFDFYNDWVNGVIYFPRWMRKVKRKKKYKLNLRSGLSGGKFIKTYYKDKVLGCMNSEDSRVKKSRYYTQQCSILHGGPKNTPWTIIKTPPSCSKISKTSDSDKNKKSKKDSKKPLTIMPAKCHKKPGMAQSSIFGKKSGLVTEETTMLGQNVYYLKPCEWNENKRTKENKRTLLFATDIVLLGTLNDCDENGIPQAFQYLNNTSYIMPTNLALTTMDDDSYIYAGSGGTICASSKSTKATAKEETSVRRITPDYESTYRAYENTETDAITYENNDDPIPVTEAAGIMWNYSGPGQDDVAPGKKETPAEFLRRLFEGDNKKFKYLYYPGGHFLGLTCVNAESNIKSCVNLQRICEMGATMSQRRETLRGYDQETGAPKYKYYVPTGLISNVDIEGATFRSMFATLNHNKLLATDIDSKTGYNKYAFRFLYPDGFDGSMALYVHTNGSPYNVELNQPGEEPVISDATSFFERFKNIFSNWTRPDDYDKEEPQNTKRRTVEEAINDYYMFRFGLDTFKDEEQGKHYLIKTNDTEDGDTGYGLPQYENSFYFYFGLKDGSTALDEFKKQFFSQCEANTIARTPAINVTSSISECLIPETITLTTENMYPPLTVKVRDNMTGKEVEFTENRDSFNLLPYSKTGGDAHYDIEYIINHEYTVTVTDTLDQILTKTFIVGEDVIKATVNSVNFRKGIGERRTGTPNLREGGYVRINDVVTILDETLSLNDIWSEDTSPTKVSFYYTMEDNAVPKKFGQKGQSNTSYLDSNEELQQVFYLSGLTSSCTIYMRVKPAATSCTDYSPFIPIYNTEMVDNKDVELYAGCDYLSYKTSPGIGLSAITEENWDNKDERFTGITWDNWLMRHTFYRQTQDYDEGFDSKIYASPGDDLAVFGQPESGNTLPNSGGVLSDTYYYKDLGLFPGYSLDISYSVIPTLSGETIQRSRHFDAMSYSEDGRAAADVTNTVVSAYTYDSGTSIMLLSCSTMSDAITSGHGCVLVLEDGTTLFGVRPNSEKVIKVCYDEDIYGSIQSRIIETEREIQRLETLISTLQNQEENIETDAQRLAEAQAALAVQQTKLEQLKKQLTDLLNIISVYPTMRVPVINKPFYSEVSAVTWNVQAAGNIPLDDGSSVVGRIDLPLSYKVEGAVHNGLTFNNHFASGDSANYLTYMIFRDSDKFVSALTANTSVDYMGDRKAVFGRDTATSGNNLFREIIEIPREQDSVPEIDSIEYAITEGTPDESNQPADEDLKMLAKSGYYSTDYGLERIEDNVSLGDIFYDKIRIMSMAGPSNYPLTSYYLYADAATSPDTKTRITSDVFFDDKGPLVLENNGSYSIGYYNENALYDKKGAFVSVKKVGSDKYTAPITQENGEQIKKTATEGNLRNSGISLYHKFTLSGTCKNNISSILTAFNAAQDYNMGIGIIPGALTGTTAGTVICRYEDSSNTGKNKTAIYKIYDLRSLDVVYSPDLTGADPYLNTLTELRFTNGKQNGEIRVTTNINYMITVTRGSDWFHISGTGPFTPETPGISFSIDKNEATDERWAEIVVRAVDTEDIVRYNGNNDQGAQTGITVTIFQTENEPAPSPTSELNVDPTGRTVSHEAGTTTFNVNTTNINNLGIRSGYPRWVTPSLGLVGNVVYTENTGTTNRSANIVVTGKNTDDQTVSATFKLTQKGLNSEIARVSVEVNLSDFYKVGPDADEMGIKVLVETSYNSTTLSSYESEDDYFKFDYGDFDYQGGASRSDTAQLKYIDDPNVTTKIKASVLFTGYTDNEYDGQEDHKNIFVYVSYPGSAGPRYEITGEDLINCSPSNPTTIEMGLTTFRTDGSIVIDIKKGSQEGE